MQRVGKNGHGAANQSSEVPTVATGIAEHKAYTGSDSKSSALQAEASTAAVSDGGGWRDGRDGSMSLDAAISAQTRMRYGRSTRILVSIASAMERERMLAALSHFPNFEVRTVNGLDFTAIADAHRTDYLIVWFEALQKLRESDANAFVKLSRYARVIIALTSDRLLEAASTLHLADAWLFTDQVLDQIGMLVGLSNSGYTIVPSAVGGDFGLDDLRLQLLNKLESEERLVLEQLGNGRSNRDIAGRLAISEPQTKAIVRNILGKLHFRNRTEAAVFMARRRHEIDRIGVSAG